MILVILGLLGLPYKLGNPLKISYSAYRSLYTKRGIVFSILLYNLLFIGWLSRLALYPNLLSIL